MPENFETWLRIWIAENIGSLGDHAEPSASDTVVLLQANELTEDATHAGFYGELVEAAKPYGGVERFVRQKLEEANRP